MPDSLTDRQFETHRRVQPGRTTANRKGTGVHAEEYATAVVEPGGDPVVPPTHEILLWAILQELRALRRGLILAEMAEEVDSEDSVDDEDTQAA